MTKDEFIDHWRDRITGMAFNGYVFDNEEHSGPMKTGYMIRTMPAKIQKLLDQMFETAQPSPPPSAEKDSNQTAQGATNGSSRGAGNQTGTPSTRSGTRGDGQDRGTHGRA